MNRLLIDGLDGVNTLLAVVIIAAGGFAGYQHGAYSGSPPMYAIIGAVGGLVAACVICGLLATFIQIEKHLRKIAAKEPTPPSQ